MFDYVLADEVPICPKGLFPPRHTYRVRSSQFHEHARHSSLIGISDFLIWPASPMKVVSYKANENVHRVQCVEYLILPYRAGSYVLVRDETAESLLLQLFPYNGDLPPVTCAVA